MLAFGVAMLAIVGPAPGAPARTPAKATAGFDYSFSGLGMSFDIKDLNGNVVFNESLTNVSGKAACDPSTAPWTITYVINGHPSTATAPVIFSNGNPAPFGGIVTKTNGVEIARVTFKLLLDAAGLMMTLQADQSGTIVNLVINPAETSIQKTPDASCPGTTPPPPTGKQPCKCTRLIARIPPKTIAFVNRGSMYMEFAIAWTMSCQSGAGRCNGEISLLPTAPAVALGAKLKPGGQLARFSCTGPCGRTTNGVKKFVLTGGPKLGAAQRGRTVKSIQLRMLRSCQDKRLPNETFTIVFDPKTGLVDKKASDLNADGKKDG